MNELGVDFGSNPRRADSFNGTGRPPTPSRFAVLNI